ncbi:MAG: hypothetical protein CME62_15575 [Halobacteriovoraceae bacterium]|nr:hypothetical protein [Halobacteriovoraceae bacterium]
MKNLFFFILVALSFNSFACGNQQLPEGLNERGEITSKEQKDILMDFNKQNLFCATFDMGTHKIVKFSAEIDAYATVRCMGAPLKAELILEDESVLDIAKIEKTAQGDVIIALQGYGTSVLCSKNEI